MIVKAHLLNHVPPSNYVQIFVLEGRVFTDGFVPLQTERCLQIVVKAILMSNQTVNYAKEESENSRAEGMFHKGETKVLKVYGFCLLP